MRKGILTGVMAIFFVVAPAQAREHRCNSVYAGEAKIHIRASHTTSCAVARAGVRKGWYIQAHKARIGVFRYTITVRRHKYGIKATFSPPSAGGGRMYAKFTNRKRHLFFEATT